MRRTSPSARAALLPLFCLLAAIAVQPVGAVDVTPPLPTPQLQQRYVALIREFRCMQCQDESLYDSEVDLAGDMRGEVRDLLLQGKSDQQVRDYMVSRYGEFILFRPPLNWRNAWLWGAPGALMLIGAAVAWRIVSTRRRLVEQDDSEPEDTLDAPHERLPS